LTIRNTDQVGLSWTNYLILGIFAFATSVTIPSVSTSNRFWWHIILANLGALLMCYLWFMVFDRLVFRKPNTSVATIFTMAVGFGFIKGFFTGLFVYLLGAESDLVFAITGRIAAAVFLGLLIVPLIEFLEAVRQRYENERSFLIAALVNKQLKFGDGKFLENKRLGELESYLETLLAAIDQGQAQKQFQKSNFSNLVRDLIDQSIRPASHEIWQSTSVKYIGFTLTNLLKITLRVKKFSLPLISSSIFMATALTTIPHVGWVSAFARAALAAAIIFLIFSALKPIPPMRDWLNFVAELFAISSSSVLVITLSSMLFGPIAELPDWPTIAALFLLIFELRFLSGIIEAAKSSHTEISAQILEFTSQSELDRAAVLAVEALQARKLANLLHGEIQNRLLSAVLRYEHVQGGLPELRDEVSGVLQLLQRASDELSSANLHLSEMVSEQQKLWGGFAQIDLEISNDFDFAKQQIDSRVQLVLEEAISNSIRHGLATRILVKAHQSHDSQSLLLEIVDNGVGVRKGPPGLGTQLFSSIAGSAWSIENLTAGGTILRIQI
jgi:two-component sensor histidine kinase